MASEDAEQLTVGAAAQALGVPVNRVHQYLRDGGLVAVTGTDGVSRIPSAFIRNGAIVKGLPGVITVLRDAHFGDEEIVGWLLRDDPSLPGRPIQALHENRGREVNRRAQIAGY
jgi:Rv2175c C-terminal domain of unknown function